MSSRPTGSACASRRRPATRRSSATRTPMALGARATSSSRCAAAAHRLEEVARAPRAIGVLVAELLLVAGRLRDAHALPVGLELIGDDHGHAGPDALPHLGPMTDDRDRAVL